MDAERARAFLLTLPHVVETEQWGNNLVYWVGDKLIGGKMCALINLDDSQAHGVVCYAAGSERYAELIENEGLYPAPYTARIYWVAARRWDVFRNTGWEDEFRAAHTLTSAKLPPKVCRALALPPAELKRLIAEQNLLRVKKIATKKSEQALNGESAAKQ